MGSNPAKTPQAPEPHGKVPTAAGTADVGPAWLDSERLFAGRTEIRLRHRGEEYRLRITRQGKLILTK